MKSSPIRKIITLLKQGKLTFILAGIRKRIYSKNESYGLKRDLKIPFINPEALVPLVIRPFEKEDDPYFNSDSYNQGIVEADFNTAYVACTQEGEPCYRQWLIGHDQNDKIQNFWNGSFPVLKRDEALLESAFTIPDHRGKRIMPAAMARIAEKGKEIGARYIITFVGVDNIPSLKGCKRSGFKPYTLRAESWFLLKKRIKFEAVNQTLQDDYNSKIS
ncbi:MAG: GNAT family N-acetyltransferase [Bacteroidia bacterium]|nr:GNAT family N-acetyltransferase [Bacteroidia bacterium]MBT8276353.1 GNAT family N-acetyltransferase [Bacteroidia bacterium]